jgi:LysR family transcriptional regulator, low CO2-responsive transcriptional regulator
MAIPKLRAQRSDPARGRRDNGVTLAGLRAFVAVAQARSFSVGARALGLTQPSVSIQMAALEQACGLLLCRRKPEFELTEAGQALLVRARVIVLGVDEFEASLKDLQHTAGRVTVGVSVPHVAMPLIAGFLAKHPATAVQSTMGNTSSLLDALSRCRIDLGVMTLIEPVTGFDCIPISTPRLMVCVRSDDPWARRSSLRIADLASRALVFREPGSQTRSLLESQLAREGLVPQVAMHAGTREAMREAVAAGLGVGAMFEDEHGHDARLAMVTLQGVDARPGVYAVLLKESLGIPSVRAFVNHILSVATQAASPRARAPR